MNKIDVSKYNLGNAKQPVDQQESMFTIENLEKLRIKANSNIPAPEYVVKINGVNKCSKGNISMWKGKAKSKKTFAMTMFAATVCGGLNYGGMFQSVKKGKVAYFDTEQSPADVHKVVKRLNKMVGTDDNLMMYGLRPYSPADRIKWIQAFLNEKGNDIDVLVIDGIRDMVMDINSAEEATIVSTLIMKWSYDYNIHISTILHENKSDGSSRGHIGTEIDNKSELVLRVKKDDNDKNFSWIEEVVGRGKGFDEFSFYIDKHAIPVIAEKDIMNVNKSDIPF